MARCYVPPVHHTLFLQPEFRPTHVHMQVHSITCVNTWHGCYYTRWSEVI